MKDERKTKKVLIEELEFLRQRVTDLESDSGEREMAEKMEKYELVLDSITDVVFQMDLDLNWIYVTPSVEKFRGYTPEEVLKQGIEEVLTPESINTVRQTLGEELAKEGMKEVDPKRSRVMELQIYHKDGSLVWAEVISTFLRDEEGKVIGLQGVNRNIEERKEAQEESQKSKDQYRMLFEADVDGILIRNMDGDLVRANPAACSLLRSTEEELIGTNVYEMVHSDDHGVIRRQLEEISAGRIFKGEGLVKRSDGSKFIGSATVSPVEYDDGPHMMTVLRDVTKIRQVEADLRESEEKYRELVEGTNDLIIRIDAEDRLTFVNHMSSQVFGLDPEECLGKKAADFMHPDDRKRSREWFSSCIKRKETSAGFENRQVNSKTGAVFDVLWTCNFHYDANGKFESGNAIGRNTTHRKQIENDLVKSEEKLQSISQYSPNFILALDLDYNITFANRTLTGRPVEEIIGSNLLGYFSEETQQGFKDTVENIRKTGKQGKYEMSGEWSGDKNTVFETRMNPVYQEGEIASFILSIMDITDREQAQRDLLRHYKLSDAFLEAMPCFAVLLKSDRTVVAANKIAKYMGGTIGHSCYGSIYGFEDPCWWCLAPKLLKTGEPQHTVVEALGVVWDAYWVPIEEDLYLHYAFDITERIHAEREKNKLEEQLQHAQKMESLGVLAGGIAHDFNNLLMGIVGNVGMARMKTSPEAPCYVYIDRIETAAERASELTNQMLAYSGRGKFLLKSINLTTLVEEMTHLLGTVMDKNVVLEMNLDKDISAIEADPSQIQQVVMNLLTNASDALGGQSGFVAVSTGVITCDKSDFSGFHFGEDLADGEYVFIEVTDNGHGIDEKGLGNIFDPFYTTKEGGRGLGLSAVIGIVRGHQGAIDVTSRPDKGTTFKILFPAGERPPEKADEEKPVHTDYMGEGTILVVDDERAVLEVARSILAEFGFNVITASDGLEALEVYEEYADEILLVLMDLTMPNMGGFEAFSQLKNFHKDLKVILSSGFTKEDALSEFSDSGLVDFIQKPYSPEKLISTIRKALED